MGRWEVEKANLGKARAYVTDGGKREVRKSTLWRPSLNGHLAFLKRFYLFIYLERRLGREKERERNIDVREKH